MKAPFGQLEPLEARIAPAVLLGIDHANHLYSFDSASPGPTVPTPVDVTGLGTGETLVGIDFRPATGVLYGLTVDAAGAGHVYAINPTTGTATLSATLAADPTDGTSPFTTLSGTHFGIDFDPAADKLRIVTDTNLSLAVNVDSGRVVTDEAVVPGASVLEGSAYTHNFAGATTATLFHVDVAGHRLVTQDPATGALTAVGDLGIVPTGSAGFDIISTRAADGTVTEVGLASLTVGGATHLYNINLTTGEATLVGQIGDGAQPLFSLAATTGHASPNAFSVDANGHLLTLNTATPNLTTDVGAITGLGATETVIGFDFRPADGLLYLITKDGSKVGRIYTVDTSTASATLISTLTANPSDTTSPYIELTGSHFGVDFNPSADRLRIVSDTGQSLRVSVSNGQVITDTALTGSAIGASGAAYSNNVASAGSTVLYDIDPSSDRLVIQDPTTGVTTQVGTGLGVDVVSVGGFDIHANGDAFATLTVGTTTSLYKINLQTGTATPVGKIGDGTVESLGFALAPSGTLQFNTSPITVGEQAGTASVTINRVGGSDGEVSVVVKTSNGSAVAASDYTAFSQIVTFADGELTKTISIPIANDNTVEGVETFVVSLSDPAGTALNGANKSVVTIADNDANLFGLSGTNHLLGFNSNTPGTIATDTTVIGLGTGETLVGIDFRPATGALYGVSVDAAHAARLYVINPTTGAATLVAKLQADSADTTSPFTTLTGTHFAVDFDPANDQLRIVDETGVNLHVNPNNGNVTTDTAVTPGTVLGGAGYTKSYTGATGSALYQIDVTHGQLVLQTNPNDGTFTNVGALGVAATSASGFDIVSHRSADGTVTNVGYATLTVGGSTGLYSIDLNTGAATLVGAVGTGTAVLEGLAASISAPSAKAFTIDGSNNLISFDTATPNLTTTVGAITGLVSGDTIVGFDFRPADGKLYLLAKNAGVGRLYTVNLTTGVASSVGTLLPDGSDTSDQYTGLNGTTFGVDFDPAADRLRVVSDTGQDLIVNVSALTVVTDPALSGAATKSAGAAYAPNVAGTAASTLYDIDITTGKLYTQVNGVLTPVGALGVTASAIGGFDIHSNGRAYATLTVDGTSGLYSIDLTTGSASLVGQIGTGNGAGVATLGVAIVPTGTFQFSSATSTVAENGGTMAQLTVNRVGGSEGAATVIVKTGGGTATAGTDYTALNVVVSFAAGETSKTISVPITDDNIFEGNETFQVTLSEPTGGAGVGGTSTSTVTITDNEAKPTISIADVREAEGGADHNMLFTVTLSGPSSTDTTFQFASTAGTATEGLDYEAANGSLVIPAGATSVTIPVKIKGDFIEEANETFTMKLSNISSNATAGTVSATGTLLNDDGTQTGPRTLTYLDVDGDRVTLTLSKGTLDNTNYLFQPAGNLGGVQLVALDLSETNVNGQLVHEFAGANVTLAARRTAVGGDGFVNIGFIDSTNSPLGVVNVHGDIGRIYVGPSHAAGVNIAGITTLVAQSMGRDGVSTQAVGGSLESRISGNIGSLVIRSELDHVTLLVDGKIAAASIGGLDTSTLVVSQKISAFTVLGSMLDSTLAGSSSGPIRIRGDLDHSNIYMTGVSVPKPAEVNVLSLLAIGGSAKDSNVLMGYNSSGNAVNADVATGPINVNGDWVRSNLAVGIRAGNDGQFGSGDDAIISNGVASTVARIASITIRGQVLGTPDATSATDSFGFVAEQIGVMTVGGTKIPVSTTRKDIFDLGATGDVHLHEYSLV